MPWKPWNTSRHKYETFCLMVGNNARSFIGEHPEPVEFDRVEVRSECSMCDGRGGWNYYNGEVDVVCSSFGGRGTWVSWVPPGYGQSAGVLLERETLQPVQDVCVDFYPYKADEAALCGDPTENERAQHEYEVGYRLLVHDGLRTDVDGRFEFRVLVPARYIVGA